MACRDTYFGADIIKEVTIDKKNPSKTASLLERKCEEIYRNTFKRT
ncbi:MAG: hypothetical protein ACXQTS_03640 [Candidatus Methanospirareceae archaeon]